MIRYNRLNSLLIFFTILFVSIVGRLMYLQIGQKDDLTEQAVKQRAIDTKLKVVRGNIYDRRMIPFTNAQEKLYIVAVPNFMKDFEEISRRLAYFTGYGQQEIVKMLERQKPVIFVVEAYERSDVETQLEHPGIKIVKLNKRYGDRSLARHLVGYVNDTDDVGYAGIEKVFNQQLTVNKSQSIGMIGDAFKRSIPGLGYRVTNCFNEKDHVGIRLTLDYHIQRIVEEVMDRKIRSGAVVIADIDSGDILAMASRPNYSQNHIEQYMDSKDGELVNKVFAAYDLGSIFKIIVATAALEDKVVSPQTLFHCTGHIDVDGKQFNCSSHMDGHGEVDFLHAFAYSCNSTFIDVGLKVGYNPIVSMAKRFGLGRPVDLLDGLYEQSGYIPENRYVSSREIANISIGQGEILVTPIQVVDMVTTIANNGVRKKLNIADAVVTDMGNTITDIRQKDDTRIISARVAEKIQRMMEEVTLSGTGTKANLDEYGGTAGKTGSAETGWMVDGETKVHAWFAGYFPAQKPKYAMVILVDNGRWGGSTAAPIFRDIAEQVMKLNY
ncbi:MAG: penicillin-binding protein 2 [Firmicutes bacterium]|nr:penicillin-binding protein 2 [Bacillota bacterium]